MRRLRSGALTIAQASLAASLAWIVASTVVGHENPFFAPMAATSAIGASVERRTGRVVENVFGVAVGVLVGDMLIGQIGTGAWQIGLVVALAMAVAIVFNGGPLTILQASSTAIVIATITPPTADQPIYVERFVDALVGGSVGLVVAVLVLPLSPIRTVRKVADPLIAALSAAMHDVAQALDEKDEDRASQSLAALRGIQVSSDRLQSAITATGEVVALAPMRWRDRDSLKQYRVAAGHIDHAGHNARVLARQAVFAIRRNDPIPPGLSDAVRLIAAAITDLGEALASGSDRAPAQRSAIAAAGAATEAMQHTIGIPGQVIASEVRSVASDVLYATGVSYAEATRLMPDLPPPRARSRGADLPDA